MLLESKGIVVKDTKGKYLWTLSGTNRNTTHSCYVNYNITFTRDYFTWKSVNDRIPKDIT